MVLKPPASNDMALSLAASSGVSPWHLAGSFKAALWPARSQIFCNLIPHFLLSATSTACSDEITSVEPLPEGFAPGASGDGVVTGESSNLRLLATLGGSADPYPRSAAISRWILSADLATMDAKTLTMSSLLKIRSITSCLEVRAVITLDSLWSAVPSLSSARVSQISILSKPRSLRTDLKTSSKIGRHKNLWIERSISSTKTEAPGGWRSQLNRRNAEDFTCSAEPAGGIFPLVDPLVKDLSNTATCVDQHNVTVGTCNPQVNSLIKWDILGLGSQQ